MSRHPHIERATDPNDGQYFPIDSRYNAGYEDGKKEGLARGKEERDALRAGLAEARAEVARQHDEILHLRIYAPGRHVANKVVPIKQIAPTDFEFWGIKPDTEITEDQKS